MSFFPPAGTKGTIAAGAYKGQHGTVLEPQGYWVRTDGGARVGPFYNESSFKADPAPAGRVQGFCMFEDRPELQIQKAKGLGAGWGRVDYQPGKWDAIKAACVAANFKALPILGPEYISDLGTVDVAGLRAALDFLAGWSGDVVEWVNEPWLAQTSGTSRYVNDPLRYCRDFKRVADAIHAYKPNVRVLMTVENAPEPWSGTWHTQPDAKAAAAVAGAMCSHPYAQPDKDTEYDRGGNSWDFGRIFRQHEAFPDKKFWITEIGWNNRATNAQITAFFDTFFKVTLPRMPWVEAVFPYKLRDDSDSGYETFGVLANAWGATPYAEKPQAAAVARGYGAR